ncbi:MAG TPA: hypothetical protein VE987_19615 [Polyangiaceae bacterium]|nr:hypothetical protein [Polyangiaceae bacterium]
MTPDAGGGIGWWGVPLAVAAGAVRVSTPFLFVSLGECITEKSGRVNLGLEGTLVMGAMSAYGASFLGGSPWLGVLVAGTLGAALGALHGWLCGLPRVNDVAVGIALVFAAALDVLYQRLDRVPISDDVPAGESRRTMRFQFDRWFRKP